MELRRTNICVCIPYKQKIRYSMTFLRDTHRPKKKITQNLMTFWSLNITFFAKFHFETLFSGRKWLDNLFARRPSRRGRKGVAEKLWRGIGLRAIISPLKKYVIFEYIIIQTNFCFFVYVECSFKEYLDEAHTLSNNVKNAFSERRVFCCCSFDMFGFALPWLNVHMVRAKWQIQPWKHAAYV